MARPAQGLDTEDFIRLWVKHDNLDSMYEEQVELCKKAGRTPLDKLSMAAKAYNLRARGVPLDKKKVGPKAADVDQWKKFVEQVRAETQAGKAAAITPTRVPTPPPPEVDVPSTVKDLLSRLRGSAN